MDNGRSDGDAHRTVIAASSRRGKNLKASWADKSHKSHFNWMRQSTTSRRAMWIWLRAASASWTARNLLFMVLMTGRLGTANKFSSSYTSALSVTTFFPSSRKMCHGRFDLETSATIMKATRVSVVTHQTKRLTLLKWQQTSFQLLPLISVSSAENYSWTSELVSERFCSFQVIRYQRFGRPKSPPGFQSKRLRLLWMFSGFLQDFRLFAEYSTSFSQPAISQPSGTPNSEGFWYRKLDALAWKRTPSSSRNHAAHVFNNSAADLCATTESALSVFYVPHQHRNSDSRINENTKKSRATRAALLQSLEIVCDALNWALLQHDSNEVNSLINWVQK